MAKVSFRPIGLTENAKIYVRFTINHDTSFRRKTDYIINLDDWNDKDNMPKQKRNEVIKKLTIDLQKLSTQILESYNTAVSNNVDINAEWLQEQIDKHHGKVIKNDIDLNFLVNYFDHYMEKIPNKVNRDSSRGVTRSTVQRYASVKKIIVEFEKYSKKRYKLNEVGLTFQNDFLAYLTDIKKYSNNYTGRVVTFLKTILRDAKVYGFNTHQQMDLLKGYKVKIDKVCLSFEDINKIQNTPFSREALTNAKDWLIIGCYIGQRVSDLLVLTKDKNIKTVNGLEIIQLTQQKTGKIVAIALHPIVKDILDKRDGEFPHTLSDQKFNEHIKDVCKLSGINGMTKGSVNNPETNRKEYGEFEKWQLVTSHICRRSFATNFYGTIPTPILIKTTGHSTEAQFLEYIGKPPIDYAEQLASYWTTETLIAQKKPFMNVVRQAN